MPALELAALASVRVVLGMTTTLLLMLLALLAERESD